MVDTMSKYAVQAAGSSMTGKARKADDFYATVDDNVTLTLMVQYDEYLPSTIWEAACGTGEMSRVIATQRPDIRVVSTDLVHRGFGLGGIDFLKTRHAPVEPWGFITNPPFTVSEEMVRHALDLGASFVAILAKSQWWNAAKRFDLWSEYRPAACHPLTWRVDFDGRGAPTMDLQWIVWGDVPHSNEPLRRIK